MIIGVPKEIKDHENRVAITPAGVDMLVSRGHRVLVQSGAGLGSAQSDERYAKYGAEMVDCDTVFEKAEIIAKVKEPMPEEIARFKPDQIVYTFFHFAASRELTKGMMDTGATCVAYETVQTADGALPLLAPMSEVAGRVAVSAAVKYLEEPMGGKGKLLSGIPGVRPGYVVIIGGGIAGTSAARLAAGLGASVYVLDTSMQRLRELEGILPPNVRTVASNRITISELVAAADVVIGSVLIPGARAPKLVSREMVREMEDGGVIIDIAVDQGGCVETMRPTSHSDPVFVSEGVVHYGVTNMPGAVSHTSTYGLTNATMPYLIMLAEKGWKQASRDNPALRHGVNIVDGKITHPAVAEAYGVDCAPIPGV